MLGRKEEFKKECKLINLKYEYEGYVGKEQWAVLALDEDLDLEKAV